MKDFQARLAEAAQRFDSSIREEDLISLFYTNLDPVANTAVKDAIVVTRQSLRVFREETVIFERSTEDIEALSVVTGVGCSMVELECKSDGEHILFARADGRLSAAMARSVKQINHYLRFGSIDRRASSAGGRQCPKCGRPYPRGSHTCPRCASKKKSILRLFSLALDEKWRILISIIFYFLGTAVSLALPMANRTMVDGYIQNSEASSNEGFWIGFVSVVLTLLLFDILRRLMGMGRGYFLAIAGNNLIVRLRDAVFAKIQQLSISKLSQRTSGELMKRVNGDTRQIKQFLISQLPSLMEQFLLLFGVGIYVFVADWRIALVIILPMPFIALAYRLFWNVMGRMYHRRWQINSDGNAVLHDIFSGIRVVKSYGMEKREEERFVGIAAKEREAQLRVERFFAFLMPALNFIGGIGEYVILYYVGSQMLAGEMTAGQMAQFSAYASMVFGPMFSIMGFPREFMNMMTSLTRVYEIMDEEVEETAVTTEAQKPLEGYIDVNNISFGYADEREVIHNVDLHIKPGEFIGLVGKSGVGKSTLINLIMRMYDVDEGSITIDGRDVREIPEGHLRSQMGVVLQENFLFTGTIWQNITYAKQNATREEVIRAAKTAGAHEFIIRLPDGYNTYVGERGHTLSGGERQRISIARALLHDPKILILDEATASLDTETEKLIQDALAALSAGRTTIAIAHRLSTLRNATRLVVLDRGTVAEIGTHDELMQKEGIYYGLVMAQREMSKM